MACRNFVQLALEGYYDDTLVHRVIRDFMIQMGDPMGTYVREGRPAADGRMARTHRARRSIN